MQNDNEYLHVKIYYAIHDQNFVHLLCQHEFILLLKLPEQFYLLIVIYTTLMDFKSTKPLFDQLFY